MASSKLGLLLLLLLLLTAHPGPLRAQHWSHGWYPGGKRASSSSQDPQFTPRLPASSPDQTAQTLPRDVLAVPEDHVPWKGKTTAERPLQGKQYLVQMLLGGHRSAPWELESPQAGSSGRGGARQLQDRGATW
ncbi:progonadoliberin-2 [Erinaceus europaeus]|uniref:Progonadoliberin n=1 Tax=Erinaceus europaeus TaxID=9365 RepID=A0ABM3X3G3_ERIEU|nr:progonadoliberin-2 [Erinaceus europaeus]